MMCTSCSLIVDVNVTDDNANRLVTNALQTPDSVWDVHLTRSNYILSPLGRNFFPVDFAKVHIEGSDGTSEELELAGSQTGRFKGHSYPKPGQSYRITVTPTGLDGVTAEMKMPSTIPIIDLEWDSAAMNSQSSHYEYYGYVPLRITFTDPPEEKNFYGLQTYYYYARHIPSQNGQQELRDTVVVEGIIYNIDPNIATKNENVSRFTDESFPGKTYTANCVSRYGPYIFNRDDLLWIDVRLVTMSEGFYKYVETIDLGNRVAGDPFAQPVPVYSNVSNGFGIFGGVVYDVRRFDVRNSP